MDYRAKEKRPRGKEKHGRAKKAAVLARPPVAHAWMVLCQQGKGESAVRAGTAWLSLGHRGPCAGTPPLQLPA